MPARPKRHPSMAITCRRCGARPGAFCLVIHTREPKRWPHPVRKADYQEMIKEAAASG